QDDRIAALGNSFHPGKDRVAFEPCLINGEIDHARQGNEIAPDGGVARALCGPPPDDLGNKAPIDLGQLLALDEGPKLVKRAGIPREGLGAHSPLNPSAPSL